MQRSWCFFCVFGRFDPGCDPITAPERHSETSILATADGFWAKSGSKALFAPSARSLPGSPATQNLDRLVLWLEKARLRAGCTPSAPQTRAGRNVARGVEVQRGSRPCHVVVARGRAARGPRQIVIISDR